MYRAILLSVTGLLLVSQSAKADICNAAFVQAISDVYQLDSKTLLKRQLKERFCRDYASAGSKSIGVSYAGFGLDYGDSSSTAESFCRSRDENIEFQDMESVAYKSVNPENLKLLVGCLPGFKIENRSVTFDAT